MIKKIKVTFDKLLFSDELPQEGRLLNAVCLVGFFAALTALIVRIVQKDNLILILIHTAIAASVLVSLRISNRKKIYTPFSWFIIFIICDLLFPCMFFTMGGSNSYITVYFVLSIAVVFFLAWGKSLLFFLISHLAIIFLCYYLDYLHLFPSFLLQNKERTHFDQIFSFILTGFCIGVMIVFQKRIYILDKKKTDLAKESLGTKNKLLEMVAVTSEILLTSEASNLEKTLMEAMELMARCVDVDRMYIWKNRFYGRILIYEQQYEWLKNKDDKKIPRAEPQYSYKDTLPEWESRLSAGKYVNGPVSSIPEKEQKFFSAFGIRSILIIPVFLQENFWGVVTFDDFKQERTFSDEEASILRSGCLLLANATVRYHNQNLLETRLKQQGIMADISRSFISKEPVSQLINNALKQMGEFMGVSRIVVAATDDNIDESWLVYSWYSKEEWRHKQAPAGLKKMITASFPKSVPETGIATIICCNDIKQEYSGRYKNLSSASVSSFIWAPVYVENFFWGLISIEECESIRAWSESDIRLVGSVSSEIASAVARDLIDKARNAALEQAVQASKAKGNFLANMSHEMRTPMNAIIGMTAIGKNSEDINKKDYAFDKIENASTHLLGVINDILDMSKIEANKLELFPVTYCFEKMIQKIVDVISFRTDEKKQELVITIDEKIPHFLTGDDQHLAQVISNLLSNAVKFTPESGRISLNAKLLEEKDGLCTLQIEVSDSGIGISEEQQARLFSSFEQADSGTSRKYGGTGLGLAISKSIVEMMDGRIWIESEPGKGSTFFFTIKAQIANETGVDSDEKEEESNQQAEEDKFEKYTILLAEDIEINREIVITILEPTALKIDCAENGREAVNKFRDSPNKYDLILMDLQMPEMDGYEATIEIRKIEQETTRKPVPIVAMTANVFMEDIEKCLSIGMNDHVGKPLDIKELLKKLRKYLQ
jgi:signal transduction histidine kinase/ActR/RegA family two-component response regulator